MKNFAIDEELLQQIEALQTLIKNNVSGLFGGNHQTRTYGSSCEFSDYRDYDRRFRVNRRTLENFSVFFNKQSNNSVYGKLIVYRIVVCFDSVS